MNTKRNSLLMFLIMALMIGCSQDQTPKPLKFIAYAGNPVLSPGAPGEWDELFLWNPQPVFHEGVFYLIYLGGNVSGSMAMGIAVSYDGFHFSKYHDNPVLSPGDDGPGSYTVGPGVVLKKDTLWWMYYNAQDIAAFSPGHSVGRATATSLYGPWIKDKAPVISSGEQRRMGCRIYYSMLGADPE